MNNMKIQHSTGFPLSSKGKKIHNKKTVDCVLDKKNKNNPGKNKKLPFPGGKSPAASPGEEPDVSVVSAFQMVQRSHSGLDLSLSLA